MVTADVIEEVMTAHKVAIRPPKMFNVILHNDPHTTIEFVVLILMSIFYKSFENATALTMDIHEKGKGIAGTYTFEIASQKQTDTLNAARANGFPLKCDLVEA